MDFDIDSILDQLEQQANQSINNEDIQIDVVQTKKSVEELTLNDLDPYATGQNQIENEENQIDDQRELFNLDLQQIYSTNSLLIDEESLTNTVALPTAVEHLEIEVRQEILQHQIETPPIVNGNHDDDDDNDDEEEEEQIENPNAILLHSVDSIVNATDSCDVDHSVPTPVPMLDVQSEENPSEMIFTGCDDQSNSTGATTTENFDLVKNILSEIFDKPEEENLDERAATPTTTTNENENDFPLVEDESTNIDLTEDEIHQLTSAEIDRVDSLLRDIVNSQQNEMNPVENSIQTESLPIDEELVRVEQEWSQLTDEEKQLGSIAPKWISDDQTNICMKCSVKFSITRRRHHCRACGKIFCSSCSAQKVKLIHDDNREDRACDDCVRIINRVDYLWNYMRNNQKPRSSALRKSTALSSAPATTTDAEATISGATGRIGAEHKKSVTFGDGVKPGDDCPNAIQAKKNIRDSLRTRSNPTEIDQLSLFKPEILSTEEFEEQLRRLRDPNEVPIEYSIHKNLFVSCKILSNVNDQRLNCRGNDTWIFTTRGLACVSQDELIYLFDDEQIDDRQTFISDILIHIHQIYLDATKGSFIRHLCLSFASMKILSNENLAGFLYVSDSNVQHEYFPEPPFLFGLLLHREELPTAQCFPIRLLLRLGFEYQLYPWPLFSVLHRSTMFNDTQQTIMSLLCDFRSFSYTLPTIRGLTISIGSQGSVSIRIPRNRHEDIVKSLEQSSPHALSFGIVNVNPEIHSKHLVTVQNSTSQQYETRLLTSSTCRFEQILIGGNFIVINASLRTRDSPSNSPFDSPSSGSFSSANQLNAKVNTIEDGIMLQLDGDTLKILKQYLKERKDYAILAKAKSIVFDDQQNNGITIKRTSSEQLVEFLWTDDENEINPGVRSPIDHFPMDGIRNSHIHYAGQRSPLVRLRWTNLFFIDYHSSNAETFDPTRLAESLAKGFTQALTPFIDMLIEGKCRKLALRVTIDRENGSYLAGSNGEQLPPFFLSQLDDQIIPIVMKASDSLPRTAASIVLELVFYLLD